ncbi:MAG: selenide, water dikinase SelD, partial [Planctomycetaceae bacterium]
LIVQSLDFFPPLIDDPFVFGQIAAANSLSDIYAMGARPRTALNIVGFPDDKLPLSVLSEILQGGADRVALAGAVIAGGHTVRDVEIKYGLSATGVVHPDQLITNRRAQEGDLLVLSKALGTGYVTTAFKAGRCPDDVLQAATAGMSQLNRAASEAATQVGAHAVTDITGFGLAGHAGEMAQASGVALVLEVSQLPVLPGVFDLVRKGFQTRASATNRSFAESTMRIQGSPDPLRLEMLFDAQTSGGLLISVAPDKAQEVVEIARAGGADRTCIIGRVESRKDASLLVEA